MAEISREEAIECRPTRWFYLRAAAMVLMFAVFAVFFLKDWKIGYPRKNEVYYTFKAFEEAKKAFAEHEKAGKSPEAWNAYAEAQRMDFPREGDLLPPGLDLDAPWPALLADYDSFKKDLEEGGTAAPPLWTEYTSERGWSSRIPKQSYDRGKLNEQLYFGIGSGLLFLVGVFFLLRTSRRSMKVDEDTYYAPSGERIPIAQIVAIDKRKWESKGLAYLYHSKTPGAIAPGADQRAVLKASEKCKVDGMVYGQFRPEDGAPAEALFQRILGRFSGLLIELEQDPEHGKAVEIAAEEERSDAGAPESGEEDPATRAKE